MFAHEPWLSVFSPGSSVPQLSPGQTEQAQSLVPVQLMLYFLLDTQGFTGSHHRSDYKEKVLFAFYKD